MLKIAAVVFAPRDVEGYLYAVGFAMLFKGLPS